MGDVRFSNAAVQDLRDIEAFSADRFGPAMTADYLAGLREALVRLGEHPAIGGRRDDLLPGIRALRYRSHRIYYGTHQQGVVILRLLHFARQVRRDLVQ